MCSFVCFGHNNSNKVSRIENGKQKKNLFAREQAFKCCSMGAILMQVCPLGLIQTDAFHSNDQEL